MVLLFVGTTVTTGAFVNVVGVLVNVVGNAVVGWGAIVTIGTGTTVAGTIGAEVGVCGTMELFELIGADVRTGVDVGEIGGVGGTGTDGG